MRSVGELKLCYQPTILLTHITHSTHRFDKDPWNILNTSKKPYVQKLKMLRKGKYENFYDPLLPIPEILGYALWVVQQFSKKENRKISDVPPSLVFYKKKLDLR